MDELINLLINWFDLLIDLLIYCFIDELIYSLKNLFIDELIYYW